MLKIGPSLIGRRQEITINVLTDGGKPSLACRSPLIDVQVRQRAEGLPPTPEGMAVWAAVAAGGVVVLGVPAVALSVAVAMVTKVESVSAAVVSAVVAVAAWAVVAVTAAVAEDRKGRAEGVTAGQPQISRRSGFTRA